MTFVTEEESLYTYNVATNLAYCPEFDLTATSYPYGLGKANDRKVTLRLGVSRTLNQVQVSRPYSHFVQGKAYYRNEKSVFHSKSSTLATPKGGVSSTPSIDVGFCETGSRVKQVGFGFWRTYILNECGGYIAGPNEQIYLALWFKIFYYSNGKTSTATSYWAYVGDFKANKVKVLGVTLRNTFPKDSYWRDKSPSEFASMVNPDALIATGVGSRNITRRKVVKVAPPTGGEPDYQSRYATISQYYLPVLQKHNSKVFEARGSIVTRMAEQADRMTHNSTALLVEIVSILKSVAEALRGHPTSIQKFRDLISDWSKLSKKRRLKAFADLRLSEQYGIKLTFQDVATVAAWYQRQQEQGDTRIIRTSTEYQVNSEYGVVSMSEHWKCFYSASRAYEPAIARLFRYDLIGFQNLWDFLPYSFVVDWFAPVGEILQAWDDEVMMSEMSIDCITVGIKSSIRVIDSDDQWVYTTDCSLYTRSARNSFPPYAYTNSHDEFNSNILINGAALIVQHL